MPLEGDEYDVATEVALEDLGYRLGPARRYLVTVGRDVVAKDGQTLGYTWAGTVENWHQRAFTSFGGGHGVWESSGGSLLPFYARNLQSVTQWLRPLAAEELMPTVRLLQDKYFQLSPDTTAIERALRQKPDTIESHGLELRPFLSPKNHGLVWAALRDGEPIPRAHPTDPERKPRSSLVQVTNLGLTVKDSPHNLSSWSRGSTRSAGGRRTVTVRDLENKARFTGVTDGDGLVSFAGTDLRIPTSGGSSASSSPRRRTATSPTSAPTGTKASSLVLRRGLRPRRGAAPPARIGLRRPRRLPPRRGGARQGHPAQRHRHRHRAPAAGTPVELLGGTPRRGGREKTLTLSEWSSAEAAFTATLGALGYYQVTATVTGQERLVSGSFLVAAYRRPEFRVETSLAGVELAGIA